MNDTTVTADPGHEIAKAHRHIRKLEAKNDRLIQIHVKAKAHIHEIEKDRDWWRGDETATKPAAEYKRDANRAHEVWNRQRDAIVAAIDYIELAQSAQLPSRMAAFLVEADNVLRALSEEE